MKKSIFTMVASALVACGVVTNVSAQTSVTASITTDTTWTTSGSPYVLEDIIYVQDGADLTVEAGVVIQAVPDSFDSNSTNNNPGTLVVSRGSKIFGVGTATDPIIFTSTSDTNIPGVTPTAPWNQPNNEITGQNGGLILLGSAHTATTNLSDGDVAGDFEDGAVIEGLTNDTNGRYGGNPNAAPFSSQTLSDDADDSGDYAYWSIRYAGEIIGTSNEINSFSLGGVGNLTDIEFIEIWNGLDDGVEFFGGAPNTKYIAVFNTGDDSFDWDEGFRGKGQYWLVVQGGNSSVGKGSGLSNHSGEFDGAAGGDDNVPFAVPTVYNATFVGMTPASYTNVENEFSGIYFRDGGGGRIFNSIFSGYSAGPIAIEDDGGADRTNGGIGFSDSALHLTQSYATLAADSDVGFYYTHDSEGEEILAFSNNLVWESNSEVNFGVNNAIETVPTIPDFLENGDMNSGTYDQSALTGFTASAALPFAALTQDTTPDVSSLNGDLFFINSIDPRAANDATTAAVKTPADSFFDATNFIGAVGPNWNWAAGWTNAASVGQVVNTNGNPTSVDVVASGFAFNFTTVAGESYLVQSASSPAGPFTTIGSVVATGTTTTFLDDAGLGSRAFYRAILQ
ncbi:MAG: hypothetical protein AAF151_25870 [Cyanobacteria bacterium J06656_5]